MEEPDEFLLEAMREVDALYPDTPPIAPALCSFCGKVEHKAMGFCCSRCGDVLANHPGGRSCPELEIVAIGSSWLNVRTNRWITDLHALPPPPPPPTRAPGRGQPGSR